MCRFALLQVLQGIIKHGPAALQSLQILTLALMSMHMRPSACEKEKPSL